MTEPSVPTKTRMRRNGVAAAIGVAVAAAVAIVFVAQQSGDSPTTPAAASASPSSTPSPSLTPDPSLNDEEPRPLAPDEKPPEAPYDECVAWWEARGYSADNCDDGEYAALMSSAAADPARDPKLPINSPAPGCNRNDLDKPGVFTCGGDYDDHDEDGDAYVDSIKTYAPPDWAIEGDIFGLHDQDSRGLEWPGGDIDIQVTGSGGKKLETWVSDVYGRELHDSLGEPQLRAKLAAGRYVIGVAPVSGDKNPAGKYHLTVRRG